MKTFLSYLAPPMAATALLFASHGCTSSTTTTAVNADAVVITGVNAAMTAWADYVNAGKATQSQVTTVSNAYSLYYQVQLIASNTAYIYTQNPTAEQSNAAATALSAALASQTNIINLVNQLIK